MSKLTRAEAMEFSDALKNINWKSEDDKEAFAALVTTEIEEYTEERDLIDFIADVRDFGLTDQVEFSALKGGKAFIIAPGAYAPRSKIIRRVLALETDEVVVSIPMNVDQLKTGRYGTVEEIRDMATDALVGERNSLLWAALKQGVGESTGGDLTGTYNYYTDTGLSASGATAQMWVIDSIIDLLEDLPHGGIQGIVGRRKLFRVFSQFTGYSQEYLKRRDSSLLIESYRGIPLVPLKKYTDGFDVERISDTELFFITKGCVKMGFRKRTESAQATDIDTNEWHLVLRENYGIGVIRPEYIFRLTMAS